MGLIYNPSKYRVTVKALGSFFEFAPGQVKSLNDDISHFIATDKKSTGLVTLPENYLDDPNSEEMRAEKEKKRIEGLQNQLEYHRWKIQNLTKSLAQDLASHNMQIDPLVFATEGEKTSMKLVKELSDELKVIEADKLDETKKLMDQIKDL